MSLTSSTDLVSGRIFADPSGRAACPGPIGPASPFRVPLLLPATTPSPVRLSIRMAPRSDSLAADSFRLALPEALLSWLMLVVLLVLLQPPTPPLLLVISSLCRLARGSSCAVELVGGTRRV